MFVTACIATVCMAGPPACEPVRCYLLLFGGLGQRGRPNTAHTWATFVCTRDSSQAASLSKFTISWLPCEMPVKPFGGSRPGRNYSLHETMEAYRTGNEHINLWGPMEIQPSFFNEALAHKDLLDSGQVHYRVFDAGSFPVIESLKRQQVCHCVHAITRANERLKADSAPVLWYGGLITRRVASSLKSTNLAICPEITHDWLLDALDLRQYNFVRRTVR